MHVSVLCRIELFTAERTGERCRPEDILPGWTPADRLGVVVDEPMGAVGASMMMQLATALFYEVRPGRRRDQYPPLFVFHLGGPHGDFSPMDVWPARREILLPAGNPYALLGELRDRSITRLLIPENSPDAGDQEQAEEQAEGTGNPEWVSAAASGWTDAASFREQLASAYAYSPTGGVRHPDVMVSTEDGECESMVEDVLDPHRCYNDFASRDDETLLAMGAGPSTVSDLRLWLDSFGARLDEVAAQQRAARLEERRAARRGAAAVQTYRALDGQQALDLLGRAGVAPGRQNAADPARTTAA